MTISSVLAMMCRMHIQHVLQSTTRPSSAMGWTGGKPCFAKRKAKLLDKNAENSNWVNKALKTNLLALGSINRQCFWSNWTQLGLDMKCSGQNWQQTSSELHDTLGEKNNNKKVTTLQISITDFKILSFIFNSNWRIKMQFQLTYIWIQPASKVIVKIHRHHLLR